MEFCSAAVSLGFRISSDKPSVDGFEVENLIAATQLGFVCESFVRPPVTITFDFPLPIDIAQINLETQLKERRSNGFKISTFVKNGQREEHCSVQNSSSSNLQEGEEFHLGNWFSLKESKIVLKNYNYKHWFSLPLPQFCEKKTTSEVYVGALRNGNRKALNCVSSLVLTITGIHPTGSPVLKGMQIWGQPAFASPPSEKKKLIHLWNQTREKLFADKALPPPKRQPEENRPNDLQTITESECIIPDEFLDPLTFEIMKLPILLPSGNSIDSFSLEKFISEEGKWGRPASDPFTGVRFKQNFKPEPNVHLKARIDRFLLVEKNIPSSYMSARGHILTDRHAPSGGEHPLPRPKRKSVDDPPACNSSQKKVVTIHSLRSSSEKEDSNSSLSPPSVAGGSTTQPSGKVPLHTPKVLAKGHRGMNSTSTPSSSGVAGDATKKESTRHSLVRALGAAWSSTTKCRSSLNPPLRCLPPHPPPSSSHEAKQTSSEKFSLLGMSLSPLQCPCGNKTGVVFYSLKCSHTICGTCVHRKTKDPDHAIRCEECGYTTYKRQLCRAHPKSAFAS